MCTLSAHKSQKRLSNFPGLVLQTAVNYREDAGIKLSPLEERPGL